MERFEAYERIEAIIECNKLSVNNICDHDCDNCCYCYAQGTRGTLQGCPSFYVLLCPAAVSPCQGLRSNNACP